MTLTDNEECNNFNPNSSSIGLHEIRILAFKFQNLIYILSFILSITYKKFQVIVAQSESDYCEFSAITIGYHGQLSRLALIKSVNEI